MSRARGRQVLEIEARALQDLAADLGDAFEGAVAMIAACKGRVILTGVGKSGLIARKIAATFASTGTPAFFVHPTEALHGDLGMIVSGDTVIGISNSGETAELLALLEFVKRLGTTLIAITGKPESTLAKHAHVALCYRIAEEGCPLGLAPMASTTTTLALGDALAAAVMDVKGFTNRDFARFHPGGKLGNSLLLLSEVLKQHGGAKPQVTASTTLSETLLEMSDKRFGMTAVTLEEGGLGLITDGDIRRLIQQHGPAALDKTAGAVCTRNPKTICDEELAVAALALMERHKITSIIVTNRDKEYVGVVHLHDLWRTQMV
ncbi:KpsF/GutQ family sugar-phosphate isomerase [Acanthopleuribacter pedis]|uniref:KpsF/GutQ family sugar-phosphate isomerase n=1 Tax=Acanthopleuribacter pedis TaxID=442870 RepID=A0A8J7U2R1_9BACT|nr:KpsF/GutQ family sugar-phosphate isomerase [Acanthopleuribacter pedis]MBO1317533.1 KpsF/GutQ family sugar-phosphate isomerase [Acanthopleuribacter pedis]